MLYHKLHWRAQHNGGGRIFTGGVPPPLDPFEPPLCPVGFC